MSKRQPTHEELDELVAYFHRAAGDADGDAWMDLYLDAADVLSDVVSAWRGELVP